MRSPYPRLVGGGIGGVVSLQSSIDMTFCRGMAQAATFVAGVRLPIISDRQPGSPHSQHTWHRSGQQDPPMADAVLHFRVGSIVASAPTHDSAIFL